MKFHLFSRIRSKKFFIFTMNECFFLFFFFQRLLFNARKENFKRSKRTLVNFLGFRKDVPAYRGDSTSMVFKLRNLMDSANSKAAFKQPSGCRFVCPRVLPFLSLVNQSHKEVSRSYQPSIRERMQNFNPILCFIDTISGKSCRGIKGLVDPRSKFLAGTYSPC